jgi:hypothetical protein
MAESRRFFSWLIDGWASYVQWRVGVQGWTDQRQRNMLFLGMIDGGNTTLLLLGSGGLINGRDTALLLSAGRWFGCIRVTANQHAQVD